MGSPSVVRCSKPPRGVAGFLWNQWQASRGIGGSFAMESVASFPWNQWQASRGIGGSFGVEYATDTGEAGGKTTGQSVTHYIMDDARFDRTADALLATGFQLQWQSYGFDEEEGKRKAASKTKYTCPDCEQNAWARPSAHLICGDCEVQMEEQ
jgi:hypothetical protein